MAQMDVVRSRDDWQHRRDDAAKEYNVECEVEEGAVPDQPVKADPAQHAPQGETEEEGQQHPSRKAW